MSTIVKLVLAILVALIVMGLLDFFGLLNHSLNVLLGLAAGLLFFFGYHQERL